MRVNLTIFSMIGVDTWLVYSQATGSTELQSEFYVHLGEELIDKNIDSRPQHRRNSGEDGTDSNDESPVMMRTGRVRARVSCHLTPTKCCCHTRDGELTAQRLQGRCIECGKKTAKKELEDNPDDVDKHEAEKHFWTTVNFLCQKYEKMKKQVGYQSE